VSTQTESGFCGIIFGVLIIMGVLCYLGCSLKAAAWTTGIFLALGLVATIVHKLSHEEEG